MKREMSFTNFGYHATALRFSRRRWHPFRESLGNWLRATVPDPSAWEGLLIFGPSGGYCLPAPWIASFRRVDGFDPDPIARWIFQKRFGRYTRVRLEGTDVLGLGEEECSTRALEQVLAAHPRHLVVFSNLLGQLRCAYPWIVDRPENFERWKGELASLLETRSWISFHDRLSGSLKPTDVTQSSVERELSSEELISRFYASAQGGELLDHLTGEVFSGHSRFYFHWSLAPRHEHLIEAIASVRGLSKP